MTLPHISVITPSYQHGRYIEQTIKSVLMQEYPNLEYIVMDGGSTDQTLTILEHYSDALKWFSETDQGQADAINKGFTRASGELFGWLNSDDYYAPGALHKVATYFNDHPQAQFVYGDAIGVDEKGQSYGVRLHTRKRQQIDESDFDVLVNRYDFIVQPACFWRASLWHEIGELDITLHYAMDYEYWMRVTQHYPLHYISGSLAYERLYGQAKTGSGGLIRMKEIESIAARYGRQSLPQNYQPEAAALYTLEGIRSLIKGNWLSSKQNLLNAWRLHSPFLKFLKYFSIFIFFGERAMPWVWLWINRFRTISNRLRRRPRYKSINAE